MGYEELVNAIYEQAVKDCINAYINRNKWEMGKIRQFLESGAYGRDPRFGKILFEQLKKEIKIVENLINEFINSDLKEIEINSKKIAVNILKHFINSKYLLKLSLVRKEDNHLFLRKK